MKWSNLIKFMWLSVGSMPCWMPVALETRRGPTAVCLSPTSSCAAHSILEDTVFEKTAPSLDKTWALTHKDHRAIRDLAAARQFGSYQLVGHLGKGGMGEVYEVVDPAKKERLALKAIAAAAATPESVKRFDIEAHVLTQLGGRNRAIVQIREYIKGPNPFIVMEKLNGKNLEEILKAEQEKGKEALPKNQVIEIGVQTAGALEYVHTAPIVGEDKNIYAGGVVHRDVKPANLFWENGRVVLTDFGLARVPGTPDTLAEGEIAGTPAYMPPEQWQGSRVDARTDVYALGAVLFYLANGYPVYKGKSTVELMNKINRHQREPYRAAVPEELRRVIDKAMAPQMEDRFQSAGEMAEALAALQGRKASAPKNRIKMYLPEAELFEMAA